MNITALGYARLAVYNFKRRWNLGPRYKVTSYAKRARLGDDSITLRSWKTHAVKKYIALAREAGFRGSVVEAIKNGGALIE